MGRSRTMIARFVTGASARLPRSAEACVWGLLVLIPCGASESPAPRVAINRPAVGFVLPLSLQAKQAADGSSSATTSTARGASPANART